MTTQRTVDDCKRMLVKLAIKHGVAPKLISERLLSKEDKDDIVNGLISSKTLDCHVEMWKESGMCHYADGSGKPYDNYRAYLTKNDGKVGV